MSSSESGKLLITETPSASQCTEPQSAAPQTTVPKENVPTMKTDHASTPEPQSTTPEAAVTKKRLMLDTPSRLNKELKPETKVPRRALAESDVSCKIRETRQRLQEKKEVLRKLNMAKTYRTRWETQDLGALTNKWLEVCQTALEDLRTKMMERSSGEQELSLKTLLHHFGIDPELVHLNEEEDCFFP